MLEWIVAAMLTSAPMAVADGGEYCRMCNNGFLYGWEGHNMGAPAEG